MGKTQGGTIHKDKEGIRNGDMHSSTIKASIKHIEQLRILIGVVIRLRTMSMVMIHNPTIINTQSIPRIMIGKEMKMRLIMGWITITDFIH